MKLLKTILAVCVILNLTYCINYDFTRGHYQQGNLISEKAMVRLKRGMTKEEVASIMGAPLLSNTFNDNRWNYAYTTRVGNSPATIKHLVVNFSNNRVVAIERP